MTDTAYVLLIIAAIIAAVRGDWPLVMAIGAVTFVIALVDLVGSIRALRRLRRARREALRPAGKRSVLEEVRR